MTPLFLRLRNSAILDVDGIALIVD